MKLSAKDAAARGQGDDLGVRVRVHQIGLARRFRARADDAYVAIALQRGGFDRRQIGVAGGSQRHSEITLADAGAFMAASSGSPSFTSTTEAPLARVLSRSRSDVGEGRRLRLGKLEKL